MWTLHTIKATNICAFEHFEYSPLQDQATLIFGNNMDDDSQNSNGSGKSALIEAIAIALTGETLRKVNMDEIINDAYDTAEIFAKLVNTEAEIAVRINRKLSRKKPQEISIVMDNCGELEEIKQATVSDYNDYILNLIGLTKDDIFSNFILTAKKYRSFLSSSDREKKEIINRFSNGVIVDESIAALNEDMAPVQKEQNEAEKKVAECRGRVEALVGEIARAVEESANRSANKKARIAEWKESIAKKRAEIREAKNAVSQADERLEALKVLDETMQKAEKKSTDTKTAYETVISEFGKAGIRFDYDYEAEYNQLQNKLKSAVQQSDQCQEDLKEAKAKLQTVTEALNKLQESYDDDMKKVADKESSIKGKITELTALARNLQQQYKTLNDQRSQILLDIASLEKQLAGVIQCPNCKYEFTLAGNIDVDKARKELGEFKGKGQSIETKISDNQQAYDECVSQGRAARSQESEVSKEKADIEDAYNKAQINVKRAETSLSSIKHDYTNAKNNIASIQQDIDAQRKNMFDTVFEAIDDEYKKSESAIKSLELTISNCEGAIKSYEESIVEIENASETDTITSLKESKERYEQQLNEAIENLEAVNRRLNELKVQEATFIEFKTYLANAKINAISQITNDFLATIKSDIRVSLSGYTMLKSGKVRDKISVSLMRDGVDCGSFEKFSKGEQTRVELANILALHKLTNVNCEEGKGLNLLIFDEILDATDEQGLTNVFQALNETHITSLVVSHGNVAENYPNRLVVNKQNGVSFL